MDLIKYLPLIEGENFEKFKELLLEYNGKFNLTSVIDEKGIKYKHFLDSVAGESCFPENAKVLEIGSGGGFPSIPLKLVRDDLSFTLVESTAKKCEYLKEVSKNLSLSGMEVLNIRAEDGAKKENLRENFDVVCARAVARLNTLCEYCLPFVKVGGAFIAYKGDCEEELNEAEKAISVLGGKVEEVKRYSLPEDCGERSLIVIRKIKPTPPAYPRGRGLERKKPIK